MKRKFAIFKNKNKKYVDEIRLHLEATNKRMKEIEEMRKEVRT